MLETILEILGNSHFEAYVAGPIVGAAVGCLFTALGNRPPEEHARAPQEARERIYFLQERTSVHHHHHYSGGAKSSDDGAAAFVAIGMALLIATFLFAAFLPQIVSALSFLISGAASFSITTLFLASMTGRFNSAAWWQHAVAPLLISVGCFYVAAIATQAISPSVIAFAQSLLGEGALSVSLVIKASFAFFKQMRNDYLQWMMYDMLAFVCITMCALVTLLQCVHYVALSNTRASNSAGWRNLTLWTIRFGRTRTVVFTVALLMAGWFLASGGMYRLIHT